MNQAAELSPEVADIIEQYSKITAATAHETMGRKGAMDSAIKPLRHGMKIVGIALTCRCHPMDNLTLHAALKIAQPGDVIVCDSGGFIEQGSFGDVMASCAIGRGVKGLVIDGAVRDSQTISEIGFPVFSRGVSIKGTVKETFGSLKEPVSVGGAIVNTGDLIIGDDDGVVVVPAAEMASLLKACEQREEKELRFRKELMEGKTTWDMLNLQALADSKGIALKL
ncbi:4-carboxy-4-hydroxy-2-oxoadipate aldolase/oxaloacetate decarboxylase [Alcaligenaceae bacterium]|nr:4-carboxy-4-hydroxy-2-oxoadipate aldolase/oxaloacetate decarboxylase [Alcaligenaceae bacterium]